MSDRAIPSTRTDDPLEAIRRKIGQPSTAFLGRIPPAVSSATTPSESLLAPGPQQSASPLDQLRQKTQRIGLAPLPLARGDLGTQPPITASGEPPLIVRPEDAEGVVASPTDSSDFLLRPFAERVVGRIAELPAAIARGFVALPAGVERLVTATAQRILPDRAQVELQKVLFDMPIGPGVVPRWQEFWESGGLDPARPFQSFQEETLTTQAIIRNVFGIEDESVLLNLVGEVLGLLALGQGAGVGSIPAIRSYAERFGPKALKTINPHALFWATNRSELLQGGLKVTGALAAEGSLFVAGLPHTNTTDIALGGIAGAAFGGGTTALATRRASKVIRAFTGGDKRHRIPFDVLENAVLREGPLPDNRFFSEYLGSLEGNAEQLGKLIHAFEGRLDDGAIAAARLAVSKAGDDGAVGMLRAVDFPDRTANELRRTFPDMRVELLDTEDVGRTMLFGRKPPPPADKPIIFSRIGEPSPQAAAQVPQGTARARLHRGAKEGEWQLSFLDADDRPIGRIVRSSRQDLAETAAEFGFSSPYRIIDEDALAAAAARAATRERSAGGAGVGDLVEWTSGSDKLTGRVVGLQRDPVTNTVLPVVQRQDGATAVAFEFASTGRVIQTAQPAGETAAASALESARKGLVESSIPPDAATLTDDALA